MSGFVLRDVEANRVVMVRGEETITVTLNDANKTREVAAITQPSAPGQPPTPGHHAAGGQANTLPGVFSAMQQGAAATSAQTAPPTGAQPAPAPSAASSRLRRRNAPVNYNVE